MQTCSSTEHYFRVLPSDVQMLLVKWHITTNSWYHALVCEWKKPRWQAFFMIKSGMQNLQNTNCIYFCCICHIVWLPDSKVRFGECSCDMCVCMCVRLWEAAGTGEDLQHDVEEKLFYVRSSSDRKMVFLPHRRHHCCYYKTVTFMFLHRV